VTSCSKETQHTDEEEAFRGGQMKLCYYSIKYRCLYICFAYNKLPKSIHKGLFSCGISTKRHKKCVRYVRDTICVKGSEVSIIEERMAQFRRPSKNG